MASDSEHRPVETIRMSDRDKKRLIEKINSRLRPPPTGKERRRLRVGFETTSVTLTVWNDTDETSVVFSALPRNLSTHGMSLVHGQFIHPGRMCRVKLPTLTGEEEVVGKVLICRLIAGMVHEVSILFDTPIDLSNYTDFTPEEALRYHQEKRDADILGKALLVVELEADRKLYRHWMNQYGLDVIEALDSSQAYSALNDDPNIDLIMINMTLGMEDGFEVIKSMRDQYRSTGYIIAISGKDDPDMETKTLEAGGNRFLAKPFKSEDLRNLVVEALLGAAGGTGRGPIRSSLADDPEMRPLIQDFIENLDDYAQQLDQSMRTKNFAFAHQLCHQLKGCGGGYGFDPITLAAEMALSLLQDESPNEKAVKRAVDELIAIVRSARL